MALNKIQKMSLIYVQKLSLNVKAIITDNKTILNVSDLLK